MTHTQNTTYDRQGRQLSRETLVHKTLVHKPIVHRERMGENRSPSDIDRFFAVVEEWLVAKSACDSEMQEGAA
jgi:hypothetical protein